jgi:hypothetical protein
MRKVLAISSGGGHWVQMLRLRPAVDSRAVTEDIPVSGLEAGDVGVIIDYDLPACAGAPTILTRGGAPQPIGSFYNVHVLTMITGDR